MYIVLHVKYLLFVSDFNELEFSGQILEKYSNMKFHKNLFRVAAKLFHVDEWTDGHTCTCTHGHTHTHTLACICDEANSPFLQF